MVLLKKTTSIFRSKNINFATNEMFKYMVINPKSMALKGVESKFLHIKNILL